MKKITNYYILLFSVFFLFISNSFAQEEKVINLPKYDKQRLHFGFLLGLNTTDFKIKRIGEFNLNDTLYTVEAQGLGGFDLGIVSDLRMGEYFDLRFIPNLSFAERHLIYEFYENGVKIASTTKRVESTFLNFPVDVKFKSERVNNFRAYVLVGGQYGIDMISQAKVRNKDEAYVKLVKQDFGYRIGAGVDFYMEMFKLSIELKMYQGLKNLLADDPGSIYANRIEKLNSKIFYISFTFE